MYFHKTIYVYMLKQLFLLFYFKIYYSTTYFSFEVLS